MRKMRSWAFRCMSGWDEEGTVKMTREADVHEKKEELASGWSPRTWPLLGRLVAKGDVKESEAIPLGLLGDDIERKFWVETGDEH